MSNATVVYDATQADQSKIFLGEDDPVHSTSSRDSMMHDEDQRLSSTNHDGLIRATASPPNVYTTNDVSDVTRSSDVTNDAKGDTPVSGQFSVIAHEGSDVRNAILDVTTLRNASLMFTARMTHARDVTTSTVCRDDTADDVSTTGMRTRVATSRDDDVVINHLHSNFESDVVEQILPPPVFVDDAVMQDSDQDVHPADDVYEAERDEDVTEGVTSHGVIEKASLPVMDGGGREKVSSISAQLEKPALLKKQDIDEETMLAQDEDEVKSVLMEALVAPVDQIEGVNEIEGV